MTARATVCVATALLLLHCSAPEAPRMLAEVRWRGERVAVASDAPRAPLDSGLPAAWLCRGTLARLDAHVANMEHLSGLRGEPRALVYLLENAAQVRDICDGSTRGRCYDYDLQASLLDVARLDASAIEHELAHDFADHVGLGEMPALLSEGLATLWSTDACSLGRVSSTRVAQLLALPAGSALQQSEYVLGAIYVDWLITRFGKQRVWRWFESLHQDSSLASMRASFAKQLAEDLDAVNESFEAARPSFRSQFDRCGAPALQVPYAEEGIQISADFDCDSARTLNYWPLEGRRLRVPTVVEIPAEDAYSFDADPGLAIQIAACDCAANSRYERQQVSLPARVTLAPGRYRVDLIAELDSQHSLEILRSDY